MKEMNETFNERYISSPRIISCLYLGSKKVVEDLNIDW